MTTLTKQEQEKSLMKGKRKRHEKAAKIVLCNPFKKYWPLLNENDAKKLENLLKSVLLKEKQKQKIPWRKLIKLPKEIRKERIRELNQKFSPSEELLRQRECIKCGLNSVTRAISNSRINSCLLAGDVEPDIIIKHVVTLATTRGIPLLIVPKLKMITFQTIGFPCTALGIIVKETNLHFKSLNEIIKNMSLQFPVPSYYACFQREQRSRTENRKKYIHSKKIEMKVKSDGGTSNNTREFSELCVTSNADAEMSNSTLDFIPLNLKSNEDDLPVDILNRIQYICPNFKRMPVNSKRIKRKKQQK